MYKKHKRVSLAAFLSLLLFIQLVVPISAAEGSSTTEEPPLMKRGQRSNQVVGSIEKITTLNLVNLSEEGNLDWRSIATTQPIIDYDVKKPGASLIELSESLGDNGTSQMLENGMFSFSSTANESGLSNIRKARSNSGNGAEFTISVPANAQKERELKIYLGVNQAKLDMTATLGDQSYDLEDIVTDSNESGIYSIKYSGEDNQELKVMGSLSTSDPAGYFALGAIALSEAPDHGVNLALGKQVKSAPTPENNNFAAQNLLDGNYNSRFSTKSTGDVIIDLGKTHHFNEVRVYWEAAYSSEFTIQVSKDNTTWDTVDTVTGKTDYAPTFHSFTEREARYVKINPIRNSNSGYSIFEVEVYNVQNVTEANQISGITSNKGSILPNFDRKIKEYELSVGADTKSIELTANVKGGNSQQVTINGQVVNSGTPVKIPLNTGLNEVEVISSDSSDPSIQERYDVHIYRTNYNFGSEAYKNVIQAAKAANGSKFKITSPTSAFWSPLAQIGDGNRYSIAQPNLASGTPWNVKIDLGSKFIVDQVQFFSNRGSYLDMYDVQVSADGLMWNTVAREEQGNGENKTYRFTPTTAQYLQIIGKKAVGFSSVSEIEMFGVNVSMESIINSLSTLKINRGDTNLEVYVPEGYEVSIQSSSDLDAIALNGNITPKKNQAQNVTLRFVVTETSSGATQTTGDIEVTVPALADVVSIDSLPTLSVDYGKSLAEVLDRILPRTAIVTLSDSSKESLNITWDANSTPVYSNKTPGVYTFTGTVVLSSGISNVNDVSLAVINQVTVQKLVAGALNISPKDQVLPVPQSGTTKRRFSAKINGSDVSYNHVIWSVDGNKDYITIDQDGLLVIRPSNEMLPGESFTVNVQAKDKDSDVRGSIPVKIQFNKNSESAPNPLSKEGYTLYHASEFNDNDIDRTAWSDYYLRQWATNGDAQSHAKYDFEDGALVLKIDEDSEPWSPLDGRVTVSSLVSYEKTGLHKFGNNSYSASRNIPTFDGAATTKYGYFEMRAKMPTAADGSHVAWWMVGNQEDQNIYDTGTTYVSNQVSEIDINESPFNTIQANQWFSTYHQWGSDTSLTGSTPGNNYVPTGLDPESRLDSEFHNYGMEWDENGLYFYFDGKLIRTMSVQLDHRLETLLSIYTNSWGGQDAGIYPKEFAIDYFRIYKKNNTIGKINDIFFDLSTVPQKLKKPSSGETTTMKITAIPVDSMHNPVADAELEWYFASDIPFKKETSIPGASIDRATGEVTITDQIAAPTVLRVSVKSKDNIRIRQSYRIMVENESNPIPTSIFFKGGNNVNEIPVPSITKEIQLEAVLYDQYLQPMSNSMEYSLVKDTPGLMPVSPSGVSLTGEGKLIIEPNANPGEVFYVHAKSGNISNNFIIQLGAKSGVDLTQLSSTIVIAQGKLAEAVVGTEPGQYPQEAVDALNVAIEAAQAIVAESDVTQEVVDTGVSALNQAIVVFAAAVHPSLEGDTIAPTWPSGSKLEYTSVGTNHVQLIWKAAEDDTAVTSYKVYKNGQLLANSVTDVVYTPSVTEGVYGLNVTGLSPGTSYSFKVEAGDAADNWSVEGPSVTVKTDNIWVPTPNPDPTPTPNPTPTPTPMPEPTPTPAPTPAPIPNPEPEPTPEPESPKLEFKDTQEHWAQAAIAKSVELGFVNGYQDGTFHPNGKVTRGEIAAMLARALKLEAQGEDIKFKDLSHIPAWAKPFVGAVASAGLLEGYQDNTFRADKEMTRTELTVIIVRALGLELDSKATLSFKDSDKVPAWARDYVAVAYEAGLVKGDHKGLFNPNSSCTRAEAVTMILAMLNYQSI